MDAKQLIESGSLELYIMGSLPAEEMQQIDEIRRQSKEVNMEILRIENALEELAFASAQQPKPELKEEIAKRIGLGIELDLEEESVKSIIIHLQPVMRFVAAASVVLILMFASGTFYFYSKYNAVSTELAILRQDQNVLAQRAKFTEQENERIKRQLAVLSDPGSQQIILKGVTISPQSTATVYWNKNSGLTYINCSGLPPVAANEQFQLWAIVNGQPVDMGVLSKDCSIAEMKSIQNATAFAITLEPVGGRATPTLEKMYVMGGV